MWTLYFYVFNGRIIKYLKTKYNGRTMGYPDFQMAEFESDTYSYYDEIGIWLKITKSEIIDFYVEKGLPMHMYCCDNEEDVDLCVKKGASVITANDPVPLMKYLGRYEDTSDCDDDTSKAQAAQEIFLPS